MKSVTVLFWICCLLCFVVGCEPAQVATEPKPSANAIFAPVKVKILPLTKFIDAGGTEEKTAIKSYVSLIDSFGSQIKAPGVFRFELYEYSQRSSESKGKRVTIWPDIDLTNPAKNNDYWRDFLRAYEFNLPFEPAGDQSYILQTNCLCPNGKRLSGEFNLK